MCKPNNIQIPLPHNDELASSVHVFTPQNFVQRIGCSYLLNFHQDYRMYLIFRLVSGKWHVLTPKTYILGIG